jgi:hypothetical protein
MSTTNNLNCMSPQVAWKFGDNVRLPFTLIDVGEDNDNIVRWLRVRYAGDTEGLVSIISLAYAGLARVYQAYRDPGQPANSTLWIVELDSGAN